jgi:hypothetical protein
MYSNFLASDDEDFDQGKAPPPKKRKVAEKKPVKKTLTKKEQKLVDEIKSLRAILTGTFPDLPSFLHPPFFC